jgi:hypothetical protein
MKKNLTLVLLALSTCMMVSCIDIFLPKQTYLILNVTNRSGEDVYCDVYSKQKSAFWSVTSWPRPKIIPSKKTVEVTCYDYYDSNFDKNWKWLFNDISDTVFVVFDKNADRINSWSKNRDDQQVDKVLSFTIVDVPQSSDFTIVYDRNNSE